MFLFHANPSPPAPLPAAGKGEREAGRKLGTREELLHDALPVEFERAEILRLLMKESDQGPQAVLHRIAFPERSKNGERGWRYSRARFSSMPSSVALVTSVVKPFRPRMALISRMPARRWLVSGRLQKIFEILAGRACPGHSLFYTIVQIVASEGCPLRAEFPLVAPTLTPQNSVENDLSY